MEGSKLWGGRFSGDSHQTLSELNNSLPVDRRLFQEDLTGSIAYARAIKGAGIITEEECEKIVAALKEVLNEWRNGTIEFKPSDEDIHTVNERRLTELVGAEIGGKLHTGRSRNDQVATDMKLWVKKAIMEVQNEIKSLVEVIVRLSKDWVDILLPGYTHLQRAQVIRLSHWLLSYGFYLESDYKRFADALGRVDYLPLGSGAIAGNPFQIDRMRLAEELGFSGVTPNSMFAVGDRDFVVEFNFNNALLGIHLSRLAEDLILYSSKEFGFLRIADSFSTGSSLMPQKRNPDSLELVRGISGEVFGQLTGFMMTLKGLPSTYNKDLQSDKSSMFQSFDRIVGALKVIRGVLDTMEVNADKCRNALSMDMLATDIAYYLVRKGVPFRTAHHVAGEVIKYSEDHEMALNEIGLEELMEISPVFTADVQEIWNFENSAEQYQVTGGTSKSSVLEQIQQLKDHLLF